MTRDNNIYGKLVNNKFSDLLTADMNITWLQMKAVLDREMPEDKEKRRALWVSWRSSGNILAFVLLAASIVYYSYNKNNTALVLQAKTNVQEIINDAHSFGGVQSVLFFNSSSINHQNILPDQSAVKNNTLRQPSFLNPDEPPVNGMKDAEQQSAKQPINYTGGGNMSDGKAFKEHYFNVIEGLSTDKLLNKGDLIIPGHLSFDMSSNKKPSLFQKNTGWVLGAAIHYNAPMSNQERSTMNINGKKNTLVDFIPSVFAQYHFNNKWFMEAGFQFSSPQYTPGLKLFSSCVDVAAGKRKERAVWLNKLYYMSIPLSVHFKPVNGFSIGTGIQYSRLQRSLLMDEHAGWKESGSGEWEKTYSTTTVNSTTRKSATTTNSNYPSTGTGGWGTPSATATPATDGIEVMSGQFRSSDWRYLIDLNYTWKKYTIGTRYTAGINNYINTHAEGNMLEEKDRNESVQFYVRMNILDWRKKKRIE